MAKSKSNQKPTTTTIGMNVDYAQHGPNAVFRVDLTMDLGMTTSGKNRKIAGTGGNQAICGGRAKIGINVVDPVLARSLEASDIPDMPETMVGENVRWMVEGGVLVIAIDMSAEGRRSGANRDGKTRLIGTTNGFQGLPVGIRVSLNCYDPIPTGAPLTEFA